VPAPLQPESADISPMAKIAAQRFTMVFIIALNSLPPWSGPLNSGRIRRQKGRVPAIV
jgi:hypothetical protein